jgi:hypothetical protein
MITDFAKPIKSKASRIDLEKENRRLEKELEQMKVYSERLLKQFKALRQKVAVQNVQQ